MGNPVKKKKRDVSTDSSSSSSNSSSNESNSTNSDSEHSVKASKHKSEKVSKKRRNSSNDEDDEPPKRKDKKVQNESKRRQDKKPKYENTQKSKWDSPGENAQRNERRQERETKRRYNERDDVRDSRKYENKRNEYRSRSDRNDFHKYRNERYNDQERGKYVRRYNDDRYTRSDQRRRSRSRSQSRSRDDDRRRDRRNESGFNRGYRRQRFDNTEHENYEWGKRGNDNDSKKPNAEKEKPNFGLSGKLTEDTNTFRGVVIKYSEPPEARKPKRRWRLYPFKGEKALPTLYVHRESAYLMGRDRKVVDFPLDHPSCSKQHGVLQYRLVPFTRDDGSTGKRVRPYLIDLESANGTYINNKRIDARKYVELLEKDVIKFGFSSREYVLLHENSKDEGLDDDVKQEEEEETIKQEPPDK